MARCFAEPSDSSVPLIALRSGDLTPYLAANPQWAAWIEACGFTGAPGEICSIPSPEGGLGRVLAGLGEGPDAVYGDLWTWSAVAENLPEGTYAPGPSPIDIEPGTLALGWALADYRFDRFKEIKRPLRSLCWPEGCDRSAVLRTVTAVTLVRDLVNRPAQDLGPAELAEAAMEVAQAHDARIRVVVGEDLLAENYPSIHAVGRAAEASPRLIDLTWGDPEAPKVTLVGKGVCFDTGGLDLKPAEFMKLMKKDMGGAAHVLGLAHMIMDSRLPIRLRVLIPAVENSVAGNALRPLDVIRTRSGKTVEIGHTDAEGRVILADALTEAVTEAPDLLIDCATLTGAARVALGTDVPALFCNDDALADDLLAAARAHGDPVWRLPLFPGYRPRVEGRSADLTNDPEGRYGGAITAALFLEAFVGTDTPWVHMDMMAWNPGNRPGRPEGGEAQGLRALFALVKNRFTNGVKG